MLLVTERRRSRRATKARSAPAMFAPPICRRSRRTLDNGAAFVDDRSFVGFDEDGGSPANIAASGASQ